MVIIKLVFDMYFYITYFEYTCSTIDEISISVYATLNILLDATDFFDAYSVTSILSASCPVVYSWMNLCKDL